MKVERFGGQIDPPSPQIKLPSKSPALLGLTVCKQAKLFVTVI